MTTEAESDKERVSGRWRWAAEAFRQAIDARESYSDHSKDCQTCRFDDKVDECHIGRLLYPFAIEATEFARKAYYLAKETST